MSTNTLGEISYLIRDTKAFGKSYAKDPSIGVSLDTPVNLIGTIFILKWDT